MKFPEFKVTPNAEGKISAVLHSVEGFTTPVITDLEDYEKLLSGDEFYQTKKEAEYMKANPKSEEKKQEPKKKSKKDKE